MAAEPEKLAYTVEEAGRAIGVSKATLWRRIAAGELHTFKLGSRTLIRRAELERFVDAAAGVQTAAA